MSNRPVCNILIGLPASGKTTWAKKYMEDHPDAVHASADHYFTAKDGSYHFVAGDLTAAHGQCQRHVLAAVFEDKDIIIDNTNLTASNLSDYFSVLESTDYEVRFYIFDTPLAVCRARDNKNISEQTYTHMFNSFERIKKHMTGISYIFDNVFLKIAFAELGDEPIKVETENDLSFVMKEWEKFIFYAWQFFASDTYKGPYDTGDYIIPNVEELFFEHNHLSRINFLKAIRTKKFLYAVRNRTIITDAY